MTSTNHDNQLFSPCHFRKDYKICTLQLKGLPCTDGCSNEQHGQFGYPPKQMLYYMRQPDYFNIEMFENMVRWSVKWVNKYEQNMKRGNATPAKTPTRSYGSSGNGTNRSPKQGLDDNLFPHYVLCDGHYQYSLQACNHCYKWHKAGECWCQTSYFKKFRGC